MNNPWITIGIPTKDRPSSLTRLLASLHAQTYRNWDLIIVDDSLDNMLGSHGEFWLDAIQRDGHNVIVLDGAQINQAYGHNAVLWHPCTHGLIYRADDDIRLSRNFLYELVQFWTHHTKAGEDLGAVCGLFGRPKGGMIGVATKEDQCNETGRSALGQETDGTARLDRDGGSA